MPLNPGAELPAGKKAGNSDAGHDEMGERQTQTFRSALHAKRLRRVKSHPNTLVFDELDLAHARSRIDVAVINSCIRGYEIKSAKDNLDPFARRC
ncbi:hypothetical protein [Nitrobacter sp. TKz-YC01]|uniref:hypothetical protein n=1 Tax=Nitrobacter sp. TKz-YC01 TaxID=3398703 RepID=UPI003A0FE871